jgi:hypothetical protein
VNRFIGTDDSRWRKTAQIQSETPENPPLKNIFKKPLTNSGF